MSLADITFSIPNIMIAILLAALYGPSYGNVILIVGIFLWPQFCRQVRGEVLSIKVQDFVASAIVSDCSTFRIMVRHLLPNLIPTLLVITTLQIGQVILYEATLSFLGAGIPPPDPSWGVMVADGRGKLASAPYITLIPGIAILLTVMSLNLTGDWVRDRLDPKLRQM